MTKILLLINRDDKTLTRLLDIWESSVRKTHTFLSYCDILEIRPEVKRILRTFKQIYCYCEDDGMNQGFIAIVEQKIEMLFLHADARGQSIGRQLLDYAVSNLGARFVDVNEQNEQALGFYKHMGFHVISRSEFDEQGRPFPLLHLKYDQYLLPHKAER
ncbi:MAG: GNAT family N-acetyltransferase [Deltaproteobacteria bacterium]|jgi:putative acetyltransferase|nr:GNAT family N-acetyltransferase [Deltaproteobacteria bacterium]